MTRGFTAHNDKKSEAVRLTRFTAEALNDMPDTGAEGKLPTDADGNSKPYEKAKLDYSGGSRSTHMIEDKGAEMTKEHRSVAKTIAKTTCMDHNLDDCSVSRRGLDRLTCHTTCRAGVWCARSCRHHRRHRHL